MKKAYFALLALPLFLVACGGGGSSGSTSTPAPTIDPNLTVPFKAAMASVVTSGITGSFNISGWAIVNSQQVPVTGSGTYTQGMSSGATLFTPTGQAASLKQMVSINATINANGSIGSANGTAYNYYDPATFSLLAVSNTNTTMFFTPYTIPTSVKAQTNGLLGTASDYRTLATTMSQTYSVAQDTASSLLVTVNVEQSTQPVGKTSQSSTVYRVTSSGGIKFVSINQQAFNQGTTTSNLNFTFN